MAYTTEREYIKVKINKTVLNQIYSISRDKNIGFEELLNIILKDGLAINQSDFLLRNELLKISTMRLKLTEIYVLLGKNMPSCETFYVNTPMVLHFYADFAMFLRKKKFTECEVLGVSKIQEAFKYLKINFPEVFLQSKQCLSLQLKTKPYKTLFPSLGIPNSKIDSEYLLLDTNTLPEECLNEKQPIDID